MINLCPVLVGYNHIKHKYVCQLVNNFFTCLKTSEAKAANSGLSMFELKKKKNRLNEELVSHMNFKSEQKSE